MPESRITAIIIKSLKSHLFRTILTALTIAASLILQVLPPLVLAKAVDALTNNLYISFILAAGYFLLSASASIMESIREGLIVTTGESITHSLRTVMMTKLHHLPAAYFTKHEAGEISSILVNDVDAVEELFSSGLISLITDLGSVIVILAVVFTKSRGLFILLAAALPALFIYTRHVQKKMLAAHSENRKAVAEASGILPETIHILRTLHVYHAEKFAEKRYDHAIQHSFDAMEKTNFYDAVYSPVVMIVSAATIGVMMSLSGQSGAFRSFFGMSVGTAVALIDYVNKVYSPLSSIGMEIQTIQSAAAGWKRADAFLHEKEEPYHPEQAEKPAEYAVSIDHVNFSYDGIHSVLSDFSLHVHQGEFVTLTGRTGAGKSTLFKLILGLYEPSGGTITLNGISPDTLHDEHLRKTICCVEQKVSFIPGTIRDQITLGNKTYSDEQIWHALAMSGLDETIRAMDKRLDTPCTPSLFSQGQQQLLMIARALVSDPEILLLDEIAAGLDNQTEKMIFEALINASKNRTVISISHRFSKAVPGRTVTITSV